MTSALAKLPDGTIELTITIPWTEVQSAYEKLVEQTVKEAQVTGFRKGKAPRKLVEEKLDKTKLYEEVLKELIPHMYAKALQDQKIKPIITPKIELKEATENKDWVIRALTCEKPTVTLGDYKKAVITANTTKHKKIWTPGQDPKKDEPEKEQKPSLDELLKALYEEVKVAVPMLLLENEVNRMLSDLIDQTKKLGLSVEQYLSSTGRNADAIRREYEEQSRRTITLEFALEEIADKEGILISDDDLETLIKTAKSDEEKKAMESQRYYLASVLRRQKTIDFLAALR